MRSNLTQTFATLSAAALLSAPAFGMIYSPTQAELFAVIDVTDDFAGGGGLYTGAGTAFGLNGTGVDYDLDLLPGTDDISRAVIENNTFSLDLSSFDSFDLSLAPNSGTVSAKTYLRINGQADIFESPLTTLIGGAPTRINLPLAGIPDLNLVEGFGIQFFNPDGASVFGRVVHAETVGEPPVYASEQLFSFESGFEEWGGSFQTPAGVITHSLNTDPAYASDGSQSLRIDRVHNGTAFLWGTEMYLYAGSGGLDSNIVVPDPQTGRVETNATQTEVDEFAARFEEADLFAVDVIVDPTLLDPAVTFIKVKLFMNDARGAFWSTDDGVTINLSDVTDVTTVEIPLEAMTGRGSGADPIGEVFEGFTDGTDIVRIGLSTNLDASGAVFFDNIRLLTEVTGNGLAADFNQDGTVDLLDLDILGQSWQMTGDRSMGDANGDGIINLLDLDLLGQEWQMSASFAEALAASGISVPEPAGLTLLALGALGMRRRSHRRLAA